MTNLYFVRHAKVNYIRDDYLRPLSKEGMMDVDKVSNLFINIHIDKIVSSPYMRAIDTIQGVADNKDLSIECIEDLKERTVADGFIDDFELFTFKQWEDFDYKLNGGESLYEVQKRCTNVISRILERYKNKNILVGTHGTFLAILLNYYDEKHNYEFWKTIKMPDVFMCQFEGDKLMAIENLKLID